MGYLEVARSIGGLTRFYPLTAEHGANDIVGSAHGTNNGVVFGPDGGTFNGKAYIQLPDHDDFSVATRGGLTVVSQLTITNWKGAGGSEYVHWMGKGTSGAHEWTFRHYVDGGSGEAASRQGRISFYHFNPSGGLGAGSYVQDGEPTTEQMIAGACDLRSTFMWKNGALKDSDALSGYNITPKNTSSPVRIGTRDMSTGFLVGKVRNVLFFNRTLTAAEHAKLYAACNQPLTDEPAAPADGLEVLPELSSTASLTQVVTAYNKLLKTLKEQS